jgi:hypothetical protein
MREDLKDIIREIELKKIIREIEEKDLRKIIKEMEEKKEEELKEKFELLNKFFLVSSSLALIIGSLWLLIYSYFIVKDFPRTIDISLFYYIFAMSMYLVVLIVFPLVFYLHEKIEENNLKGKNENINNENNFIISLADKLAKKIIAFLSLFSYIFFNVILFKLGGFFIFTIIGNKMSKLSIVKFLSALVLFLLLQLILFLSIESLLKRVIIYKDKDALLFSIIYIPILVIIIYAGFFLTKPFQLLKLGYIEANLTLEKEYVDKTELYKTYSNKCFPSQDTQTFKFFIFLRTSSEYIVGCNKNSNVRIHIPSDKVIAIEYIEEDSKKEENKNTPALQQQTPQQQNK